MRVLYSAILAVHTLQPVRQLTYMQNLGFILLFCFLAPFGFLPLRWSQAIGSMLGWLLIRCNGKRSHIARCNIRQAFPELSPEEQEALLNQTAKEAGKWFIESSYVWFRNPNYLINKVSVRNPEILDEAYKEERGVVVILPHLGNWELLNFYVPQHYQFGAMYKPVKSPLFEKVIFNARTRVGSDMFATDGPGVRKALKALKKNYVIAILSDHLPSRQAGVYAPFFGRPALTGKLTHSLAKANQSEVLLASVLRKPKGAGFEIVFQKVTGVTEASNNDRDKAATALNKAIEESILLAPAQYQWVYRRYAHPPRDVEDLYQDKYSGAYKEPNQQNKS